MSGQKYLLLTSYTYPDSSGSGLNAYRLARALTKEGFSAKVLSFRRSFLFNKNPLIVRIPYFSRTIVGKLLSLPIITTFYLIFILRTNVLVFYGNKIIAWEIAFLFAKLFRKKIVFRSLLLGVDDISSILRQSNVLKQIYKKIFRSINCYYSINNSFSDKWMLEIGNKEILFECPQGVENSIFKPVTDPKKVDELRLRMNMSSYTFIIMSAGFLIERKNPLNIFTAIAELDFKYDYYYIGDYKFGPTHFLRNKRAEAEDLFRKGKEILNEKIHFTGFVPNIVDYLKCADVFIHGSTDEIPNVVYEAMATGVPIIVSETSASLSDFLKNEVNCLVYKNEQELPTLIKTIKSDKVLRESITSRALEWINTEATFPVVIKKLNNFLFD